MPCDRRDAAPVTGSSRGIAAHSRSAPTAPRRRPPTPARASRKADPPPSSEKLSGPETARYQPTRRRRSRPPGHPPLAHGPALRRGASVPPVNSATIADRGNSRAAPAFSVAAPAGTDPDCFAWAGSKPWTTVRCTRSCLVGAASTAAQHGRRAGQHRCASDPHQPPFHQLGPRRRRHCVYLGLGAPHLGHDVCRRRTADKLRDQRCLQSAPATRNRHLDEPCPAGPRRPPTPAAPVACRCPLRPRQVAGPEPGGPGLPVGFFPGDPVAA